MRLIQEREIEKVGSQSSTKIDVRIIAATHRDLQAMVNAGAFREDLYYRLLVVPIKLPPLRDRGNDIPELVQFFFDKFKVKHGRGDLKLRAYLLPYFSNYHWAGNVRQLENTLERLVLLSVGPEITREDLPDFLQGEPVTIDALQGDSPEQDLTLDVVEKRLIMQALEKVGGNQTQAARFLGISRRTLAYRLEKYGFRTRALKSRRQSAA
jgi:DNA-binding NtrC family response regulator